MMKKIKDIFTFNILTSDELGLFTYLHQVDSDNNPLFPELVDIITDDNVIALDVDYEFGHSAEKYLSPLADKLWYQSGEDVQTFVNMIGYIIANRFKTKWKKLWDVLNATYNPIENYSMEQVRTPDLSKGVTGSGTTTTKSDTGIFGFNSTNSNPSGDVESSQEDTIGRTETETGTDTIRRSGNIGVTTSQQMIESEFELRKHDIYKLIYEDIDSILCLLSY